MKTKKNLNYLILSIVFLFGLLIGYSPNLAKTKTFHRIHAPIGIELILRLSYLKGAIHYELSVNDFNQKKIEKYRFPYTNRNTYRHCSRKFTTSTFHYITSSG